MWAGQNPPTIGRSFVVGILTIVAPIAQGLRGNALPDIADLASRYDHRLPLSDRSLDSVAALTHRHVQDPSGWLTMTSLLVTPVHPV